MIEAISKKALGEESPTVCWKSWVLGEVAPEPGNNRPSTVCWALAVIEAISKEGLGEEFPTFSLTVW